MSVPGEQAQQARTVGMPKRWPLYTKIESRGSAATKDAKIINGYVEFDPLAGDYEVFKRFGLFQTSGGNSSSEGIFSDIATNTLLWANNAGGSTIQMNYIDPNSGLTGVIAGSPLIRVGSRVSFCSIASSPPTVFWNDGLEGYIYNTSTHVAVSITDPTFTGFAPTGICYGAVIIDGTTYVMTFDGVIHGTSTASLNNATTWDPLNVIPANSDSDRGVAIFRQLNYLIALKQNSGQVFYDAGNPTGSPLSVVPDMQLPYGCAAAFSVASIDNIAFWLTANTNAPPQVVMMANLSPSIVSTPVVDRLLMNLNFSSFTLPIVGPAQATGRDVWGWTFKRNGHRFYGVTSVVLNLTLVYDIDQQEWYIWTSANGGFWPVYGMSFQQPVQSSTFAAIPPIQYYQDYNTGALGKLDVAEVYPTDNGSLVPLDIYTANLDFGTMRSKTLHAMFFNVDKVAGRLMCRYSDDDYNTWSHFRQVDLSKQKPMLADEGSFQYRRAYHFRYLGNTGFRGKSSDLQMDIGTF